MANQIYIDSDQEPEEKQANEQESRVLGVGEITKIIVAIYSLTAPYFIAFILLFAISVALVLAYFR